MSVCCVFLWFCCVCWMRFGSVVVLVMFMCVYFYDRDDVGSVWKLCEWCFL